MMKKENWQPQAKTEKQQAIAIPNISPLSLEQLNKVMGGGGVGSGSTGPSNKLK